MLRFKKKAIWHHKPRVHRGRKVSARLTKTELFSNVRKALHGSSFIAADRPIQVLSGSFKNILVRLQKLPALRKRAISRRVPVRVATTSKSTPAIIYKLCRVLRLDYKTIEGNRLLKKYTDVYMSFSRNKLAERPLAAAQTTINVSKVVKTESAALGGTSNTTPNKKSNDFKANQHSKNWIDPKVWRKMPQKERDEFLIKTGKRQRKQENVK